MGIALKTTLMYFNNIRMIPHIYLLYACYVYMKGEAKEEGLFVFCFVLESQQDKDSKYFSFYMSSSVVLSFHPTHRASSFPIFPFS